MSHFPAPRIWRVVLVSPVRFRKGAAMLLVTRRKSEAIVISDVLVSVYDIRKDKVRLAIVAPRRNASVHRKEVYDAIHGRAPNTEAETHDWTVELIDGAPGAGVIVDLKLGRAKVRVTIEDGC